MIKSFLDVLDVAQFMRSSKGHPQLVDKAGFIYNKHRTNKDGLIFWSCRDFKRSDCRARVHTKGFHIIKYQKEHSHDQPAVPFTPIGKKPKSDPLLNV